MPPSHRSSIRRLATARLVSLAGGEAAYIALVALVYQRTGSALWVSGVLIAWIGTGAGAGPFAGVLADRYDRRRVMLCSDLVSACAFVALAAASSPFTIVIIAAFAAVAEAPFVPALTGAVPNLASDEDLPWANSVVARGSSVGYLLGPLAGGVAVAALGAHAAFLANAASFLVSALVVWSIREPFAGTRSALVVRTGVIDGFRFVWHEPVLRRLTLAWLLFVLGVGVVLVSELPLARHFHQGAVGYGLLVASWAAGALVGSLIAGRLLSGRSETGPLIAGLGVATIGIGLAGVMPAFAAVTITLGFAGGGFAVCEVAEQTLLQRRTPDELRSRVAAARESVVIAFLAGSLAYGGLVLAAVGPQRSYLAGALSGVAALVVLAPLVRGAPAAVAEPRPQRDLLAEQAGEP